MPRTHQLQKDTMPGRSRPKAVPNTSTRLLSHAILEAAARHGVDKKGKDSLVGYCLFLAENHPTSFATLLGKVLPMQVTAGGDGTNSFEFTVTFVKPDGNPVS